MKVRDSGMPDESYWESLFDVPLIIERMDIRPKPDDIQKWARSSGFTLRVNPYIDLPPYHYGLIAYKSKVEKLIDRPTTPISKFLHFSYLTIHLCRCKIYLHRCIVNRRIRVC